MESEKAIFFGLEVKPRFNERVSVPLHHSFTCSITGAGKSVTERTLISRTDAKFLIIDCKTPRDYEGLGSDIPIFIDNRSDPLMIKRLLESSSRLWLRKEFPELIQLCKVGKTWEGVLEATREKMMWKHPKTGRGVHPVVREKLLVLEHLLGRLIDEMKSIKIVDTLELPHKINVMDIHGLSLGLQQLIVHSVLTKVLKEFTNVVVVIDEAHRFVPERKPSAARDAVTLLIQEGRAKNDFVWLSDQSVDIETPVLARKDGGKLEVRPIGSLTGDGWEVLCASSDGKVIVRPVSKIYRYPNKYGKLVEITYAGTKIRVTPAHSVYVWCDDGFREVPASNLKKGVLLVAPIGISNEAVVRPEMDPWLLGLMVAEGSISTNRKGAEVSLGMGNQNALTRVEKILKDMGFHVGHSHGNVPIVRVSSVKFARKMENLIGKGAGGKYVPPGIFSWKPEDVDAFFSGYLAGDGYLNQTAQRNTFVSATVSPRLHRELLWLSFLFGKPSYSFVQTVKERSLRGRRLPSSKAYYIYTPLSRGRYSKFPTAPLRKLWNKIHPHTTKESRRLYDYIRKRKQTLTRTMALEVCDLLKSEAKSIEDMRQIEKLKSLILSNLGLIPIREVKEIPHNGDVMDLSIPECQNFFGGTIPVLLHNTVTGVDKDVLKQMHVWILGCQREKNEADRTLDQLTHDLGLKRRDIYRLKTGHFLVNTREWTKLAYLVPEGMDLSLAEKVISGQIKPEEAFKQLRKMEVGDLVWKEKFEEERRKRQQLEMKLKELTDKFAERVEARVADLREEVDRLKEDLKSADMLKAEKDEEIANLRRELEGFRELKDALVKILPPVQIPAELYPPPEKRTELAIGVETKITEFNIEVKRETLQASQDEPQGQILILAAEGWFDERRNTREIRAELDRRFNSRPRPGTVENIVAELTSKQIFNREKASGKKGGRPTWLYQLRAEAKERIKIRED